jgi:IS30 family transposase
MPPEAQISARTEAQIVSLHESGIATRTIEEIVGLDHSTIARRLKRLTPRKTTDIYKALEAQVLCEKRRRLLSTSDKLSAKEQRDIATAYGIYYDKERLERGQSTSNQAIRHSLSEDMTSLISQVIGDVQGAKT